MNIEEPDKQITYDLTTYSFLEGLQLLKKFYEDIINKIVKHKALVAGGFSHMGRELFGQFIFVLSMQDNKLERFITVDFPRVPEFYRAKIKEIINDFKSKSNNELNYLSTVVIFPRFNGQ